MVILIQEDVENRTINFAISTTKLTGRTILAAARKFLQWRAGKSHNKPVGKQSVKQLLRQDQGATNIEIEKTGIRDFKRILDKYGVDYAITKNHDDPPRYLVFFKARDADTLTAAFKDYSAKLVNKEKRPSVLERLQQFKALAAELVPGRMKEKKAGAWRTMNQITRRLAAPEPALCPDGPLCYQSGLCLAAGRRG